MSIFNKLKGLFSKNHETNQIVKEEVIEEEHKTPGMFSTDLALIDSKKISHNPFDRVFTRTAKDDYIPIESSAMDEKLVDMMDKKLSEAMDGIDNGTSFGGSDLLSGPILNWYARQSFIGYQLCAMLSQHWLIAKCCLMPAEDSVRKGYEITINDGSSIDPGVLDAIRKADVIYRLNKNLVEFINMGRIYGLRIAIFKVESNDPDYYKKPFNIDGVTPGSYKGIAQVDPVWIMPQLNGQAVADPSSIYFYEPTWWSINGVLYHRTHLMIFRNGEVPDLLKPTYFYGSISVPQKIYERVYAAERTANEAPQLALTKRSTIIKVDLAQAIANQAAVEQRIAQWAYFRDNYGVKLLGQEEEAEQFDTSLNDLDAVIMTQYQIVAAAANVPATKLLGTTPKGFNSTGNYEESSYHEELESIQTHDLTPLIERHHALLIRSEIAPKFNMASFETSIVWNPLDSPTAEEAALLNKTKADTDAVLVSTGAIGGEDIRNRIINDPESGYNGIDQEVEQSNPESPDINTEELQDPDQSTFELISPG